MPFPPAADLTGYFTHDCIDIPNPLEEAPECPKRINQIETNMLVLGFDERVVRVEARRAPMDAVLLAHDAQYVKRLEAASAGDPAALAAFDAPDTRVGPHTFDAAMKSAGAVVEAVDAVMTGRMRNAFCGVRPPGHHAGRAAARGFCYLNNVAIGALYAAKKYGLTRVAIVDFDAHHGDGTEEIVAGNPALRLYSLFQWPLYPNRRMEPTPSNVVIAPLPAGADGHDIAELTETKLLPDLDAYKPELILISAGFDGHNEDQMAQLKMREIDYARLTRRLLDAAEALCGDRCVSVLEGGYSVRALARSATTHLNMLMRRTVLKPVDPAADR